jgi:hypothetical protein
MSTTLTAGDVLIEFAILFSGAFVLWLLSKSRPILIDHWGRRSASSRRKSIDLLKNRLKQYEDDLADVRLFIGRVLQTFLIVMTWLSLSMLSIGLAFVYQIVGVLWCHLEHNCVYHNMAEVMIDVFWNSSWTKWHSSALKVSLVFALLSIGTLFRFFAAVQSLLLETSPHKYRARLGYRIAQLRDRMPKS